MVEFTPPKLIAICRVTNEMMNDVPLLTAHLKRAFAAEIGFKIDHAILRGTGAGQPLGMINSPAVIQVAKETGQTAGTVVAENVQKMWTRLPAPSRRKAVWLINEDYESQLETMVTVVGTSGFATPSSSGMYVPAGTGGNAVATLKGRPIILAEQCRCSARSATSHWWIQAGTP